MNPALFVGTLRCSPSWTAGGAAHDSLTNLAGGMAVLSGHSEADVVVIGAGATGLPAAIAAREAGAFGHPGRGAAPYGRPCHQQRRQRAARRRHQRAEEARHRGFARPRVSGSHRLVGGAAERRFRTTATTTAKSCAPSPTTTWRPSTGCWRMASRSPTRRRTSAAAFRSATRCRAKCMRCRSTGRWCRPASRSIPRSRGPIPPASA